MSDRETVLLRGRAASLAPAEMQAPMARHAMRDTAALPAEMQAPVERVETPARPKLGAEHARSMLKLGFHEITAALVALPDSNIRPLEEPGVFGNEHMPHIRSNTHDSVSPQEQEPDRSPCP